MENDKFIIYQNQAGAPEIKLTLENDTLWLSQRGMAELFDKDSDTIGLHINNIYTDEELNEKATTELFSVVQKEGKRTVRRNITHYNLDVILSVGYRVSSKRGTQFRIPGKKWPSVSRGWVAQTGRQRAGSIDPHDCRKQTRRKRDDDKSRR